MNKYELTSINKWLQEISKQGTNSHIRQILNTTRYFILMIKFHYVNNDILFWNIFIFLLQCMPPFPLTNQLWSNIPE